MDYSLRRILQLTLALKLALLVLTLISSQFLPFNNQIFQRNFHYPENYGPDWTTPLKTWDGQHYLYLSEHGYRPEQQSNALYPLFPFLIHCAKFFFLNNSLAAGLYLSLLFTLLCVVYLYLLVRQTQDERTAFNSCLFLLAFPTAFYLGLVYTESLFLFLACAYFYYSREGKIWPAAVCAFLLPLARPVGILLIVPALVDAWTQEKLKDKSPLQKFILPAFFLGGLLFYLAFMNFWAGSPFAGYTAQEYFPADYSVSNILHPFHWFTTDFIQKKYEWDGITDSLLDRIFFILYLAVLAFAYRHLDKGLFVYVLVVGLVPALSGNLMAYKRYVLAAFPLFIFAAIKFKDKAEYYLWFSLPIQSLLAVTQALNNWVS